MNEKQLMDFQFTLREAIFKAEKLKGVSWPDLPVVMPLKVIVELLAAIAPLELAIGKAIDVIQSANQLQNDEILIYEGQIIS